VAKIVSAAVMHPAEELLRELYDRFSKGDIEGVLAMCTDDIAVHVPGTAPFSGDYTKATFPDLIWQVMQISGDTLGDLPVEVIADDEQAVAVLDHTLRRDGRTITYRADHIWWLRDGKFCACLVRPGDEEEFSRAWS
jgi:ketosteroid isomerase-like protein